MTGRQVPVREEIRALRGYRLALRVGENSKAIPRQLLPGKGTRLNVGQGTSFELQRLTDALSKARE